MTARRGTSRSTRPAAAPSACATNDGRRLHLLAEVRDAGGEVVAEARSLLLEVTPEHVARGARELPY